MLYPIRVAAGMGDPPSDICTNDSEAINSALKQFLGFKNSDWRVFNNKIKKFILEQEEVYKAMITVGQYRICKQYQHFEVAPSRWFTALSEKQKVELRKKFQQASVDDVQAGSNVVFAQSQFKDISNEVSECDEVNESNIAATQLFVDIQTAASITGLPTLVLQQIWAKVSELILSTSQTLPAPGSSFSCMVASKSQKPHYVSHSSDG